MWSEEMNERYAIKAKISASEEMLTTAERAGKDESVLADLSLLIDQQKKNILLTGSCNLT